jgi:catechol 2,3-dioxygenase-like lactoylglutathione lyase family enzyme
MSGTEDFERAITFFRRSLPMREGELTDEEFDAGARLLLRVLDRAWEVVCPAARLRESFSDPRFDLAPFYYALCVAAEKVGSEFRLGIDHEGLFLSASVAYPQHLSRVDDTTFALFFHLGAWRFQAWTAEIKAKSALYQLIAATCDEENLTDFGAIEVRWSPRIPWTEYLALGAHALRVLHQINYRLYRIEYQQRAGRASSKRRRQQ